VITSQRPNASVCVLAVCTSSSSFFIVSCLSIGIDSFFLSGLLFLDSFWRWTSAVCFYFLFFFFFCRASAFTHGGSLRDGMTDRISTCLDWKR
jgi:hypothetical protein